VKKAFKGSLDNVLFYATFRDNNKGLPRCSVRSISLYASAGVHVADNSIVRLKVKEAI